ncbi:MAG TPA: MDR family MFS transporter [Acetobacteraceae bacterium]|nr:MDR family MFS transporter [Acetobacteraceae bacterium]
MDATRGNYTPTAIAELPRGAPPPRAGVPDDGLPHFTHQQIIRVITGIMLCILLAAIDQTVVTPAVPAIAADLNGFGHLSWLVSAYLLTSTAMTPIYGKLSDIYGRRLLLLIGIVVFLFASVLCGLAQNLVQLIVFRALQGVGGAGLMAMAQAAIADVVAPRERGRYQGYMAGTWAIACIAGPIVGGYITDNLSWRWIFWINVPLCIAAIVLSDRALRVLPVRRRKTRIDYIGAALLTLTITAALLLLSSGGVEFAWDSPVMVATGALTIALLAALVWQERRAYDPLLPPRLFTNSVFSYGVTIAALASAVMFGATFILPLLFQLVRGFDASTAGVMLVPFLVSNTVGAFTAGQLARKLGRGKAILIAGIGGTAIGFCLLAIFSSASGIAPILIAMAVIGVAIGLCMPTSMVVVQNAAERRDIGAATGALLFLRSMGGAFGASIAGAVLTSRFNTRLEALGVHRHIDLGALRGPEGGSGAPLDPSLLTVARDALMSGFALTFWVCAGLAAAALVLALLMRDLPLQSSQTGKSQSIAH